eukprot:TRINITY_DN40977_c0_g1_i1.p1 TRINITY_DN40977_c0_g1~~TRINITY_DN40977_c0_g1_i1.p1  ORF type:complete len:540 (-),score=77.16 TRINITY_DN40977_c0_g1_i1:60-1640(-)
MAASSTMFVLLFFSLSLRRASAQTSSVAKAIEIKDVLSAVPGYWEEAYAAAELLGQCYVFFGGELPEGWPATPTDATNEDVIKELKAGVAEIKERVDKLSSDVSLLAFDAKVSECFNMAQTRNELLSPSVSAAKMSNVTRDKLIEGVTDLTAATGSRPCLTTLANAMEGTGAVENTPGVQLYYNAKGYNGAGLGDFFQTIVSLQQMIYAQAKWGIVQEHRASGESPDAALAVLGGSLNRTIQAQMHIATPYMACKNIGVGSTTLACRDGEGLQLDTKQRLHTAQLWGLRASIDGDLYSLRTGRRQKMNYGDWSNPSPDWQDFIMVDVFQPTPLMYGGVPRVCIYNPSVEKWVASDADHKPDMETQKGFVHATSTCSTVGASVHVAVRCSFNVYSNCNIKDGSGLWEIQNSSVAGEVCLKNVMTGWYWGLTRGQVYQWRELLPSGNLDRCGHHFELSNDKATEGPHYTSFRIDVKQSNYDAFFLKTAGVEHAMDSKTDANGHTRGARTNLGLVGCMLLLGLGLVVTM